MILSTKCESLELLWYVLSHVQYNVLNYFSCSICLNYIFFFVQSSQSVFNYSGLTYSNFSCCPSGWACYCFRAMTMLFTNERSLRSTNGSTRTFFCQPHADHWLPDKKRGRRKKSDEEGGGARTKAGHHFAGLECNAFSGERWHGKYSLCRYGFALHRILGLFCGQINAAAGGRRTRARMSATRSRCMYF